MTRRRHRKRLAWGAAAAITLFVALLFVVGVAVAEAPGPTIDTSATVQPGECSPCHLNLGEVDEPGLIFSHGNHLLISCEGCHVRFPHRPGGSVERVPMETCFACHGIQHGPQGELATGACEDCHTKSKDLRPKSHTTTWAAKPHVTAVAKTGANGCLMCHDAKPDCDACHEKEGVEVDVPDVYHSVVAVKDKGPSVKIYPQGEVTMSQCVYCHADIDSITGGRLIFAHTEHLRRNYSCETCHAEFPHEGTSKKPAVPDMMGCYRCHGLQHAGQGQVAGEDCLKCHPKSFELMPSDHTKKFISGDHKERASSDPAYCAMCHKSKFCLDCHTGKSTSPNSTGKVVVPIAHTDSKWQGKHGELFLKGEGACGACHDDQSCKVCHQTVMPHPTGWTENHRPPAGIPPEDCSICHRDRDKCQSCHHSDVKNAELIEENCVKCHDQMSETPATAINHKGYAEHAVHFDVAETQGKPYRCYECHVDFGDSAAAKTLELQQGHDLRLCYSCHGALDPVTTTQIAPYPGAQLCIRCHPDVNV